MKTWKNMPGPGDPETWSPYCGHPLDPRQPIEDDPQAREEAKLEIIDQMVMADIGFLTDAIEECKDSTLRRLWKGYYLEDTEALIEAMAEIADQVSVDEEDITNHIRGQR